MKHTTLVAIVSATLLATPALARDTCKGAFKWTGEKVVVSGTVFHLNKHRTMDCYLVNERRGQTVARGNPLKGKNKRPPIPFELMKQAVKSVVGESCTISQPTPLIKGLPVNFHVKFEC